MQQSELDSGAAVSGLIRRAATLARSLRRTSCCAFALAKAASFVTTSRRAFSRLLSGIELVRASASDRRSSLRENSSAASMRRTSASASVTDASAAVSIACNSSRERFCAPGRTCTGAMLSRAACAGLIKKLTLYLRLPQDAGQFRGNGYGRRRIRMDADSRRLHGNVLAGGISDDVFLNHAQDARGRFGRIY